MPSPGAAASATGHLRTSPDTAVAAPAAATSPFVPAPPPATPRSPSPPPQRDPRGSARCAPPAVSPAGDSGGSPPPAMPPPLPPVSLCYVLVRARLLGLPLVADPLPPAPPGRAARKPAAAFPFAPAALPGPVPRSARPDTVGPPL